MPTTTVFGVFANLSHNWNLCFWILQRVWQIFCIRPRPFPSLQSLQTWLSMPIVEVKSQWDLKTMMPGQCLQPDCCGLSVIAGMKSTQLLQVKTKNCTPAPWLYPCSVRYKLHVPSAGWFEGVQFQHLYNVEDKAVVCSMLLAGIIIL